MQKIIFVFSLMFMSSSALATTAIQESFIAKYPDADRSGLNSCLTCHSGLKEGFTNGYGADLKKAKYDFEAIKDQDSDGDGKTNIEEIKALTSPGSQALDAEVFVFTPKLGQVTFSHGDHQMDPKYGINGNCDACHTAGNANHFPKLFNDAISVKDQAHATCVACHKSSGNAAAPTGCMQCHKKQ